MLTNGVFKIIEVKRSGATKDGRKYVHCLAVDFFNQGDKETGKKGQFVTLKAFGTTAEYIERNMSGNGVRRAYISGELNIETYMDSMKVTKLLSFQGMKGNATFDVDVPKMSLSIDVQGIKFIDKPNEKSDEAEFVPADGEEVVTFTVEDAETSTPRGSYSESDEEETTVAEVVTAKEEKADDVPVIGRKKVKR